jgi:hypothetical protein
LPLNTENAGLRSNGEVFVEALRNRNYFRARTELQNLFNEAAFSGNPPQEPLWGMAESFDDRTLRSAIGITLEFIAQRAIRFSTVGAILHIDSILDLENRTGRNILTENERHRTKRLLMAYTLRHPKDTLGTPLALDTIHAHFQIKALYGKTILTYSKSKIFAPSIREDLAGIRSIYNKKRPS